MTPLGDNLLKLTEFPFSYSFISLLALIFGESNLLQGNILERFAPLLIVMGFVATTLSITDPIGTVQRLRLKGREGHFTGWQNGVESGAESITKLSVFGRGVWIGYYPYLMAGLLMKPIEAIEKLALAQKHPAVRSSSRPYNEQLKSLTVDEQSFIFERMVSLKNQTTKTNWLRVEIDKITGMAYFAMVISLFIIAGLVVPNFLDKFVQTFQDSDLAKLIIMVFSGGALASIMYMIHRRWQSLKENAIIVFDFLLELDAIKINRANFERPLQQIEQYLNNKEWTLARYWTRRIYVDYHEEVRAQYEHKPLNSGQQ